MSAFGQKQSFGLDEPNVRFAPIADIPATAVRGDCRRRLGHGEKLGASNYLCPVWSLATQLRQDTSYGLRGLFSSSRPLTMQASYRSSERRDALIRLLDSWVAV
jgi:hypothetical protein